MLTDLPQDVWEDIFILLQGTATIELDGMVDLTFLFLLFFVLFFSFLCRNTNKNSVAMFPCLLSANLIECACNIKWLVGNSVYMDTLGDGKECDDMTSIHDPSLINFINQHC